MDVLDEFVDRELEVIDETYRETGKETCDMVRDSSPVGTGAYASGWEVKETQTGAMGEQLSVIVCNPKHYQLTHLLEKGHAVRNQYGEPDKGKKRVAARRHIKPAEIWGKQMLLTKLREKL